jgi:hypothetical protein
MKLTTLKAIMLVFVFSTSVADANPSGFIAELMPSFYTINKIDKNKRIITLDSMELGYSAMTEFYDAAGNKVSSRLLRTGLKINFDYNSSLRFLSRPTATKIWILSPITE